MENQTQTKIKNYKELIGWTKAIELVKAIYELTKTFPKEEMYGLTSQLRRCSVSIPSNIAEGYMRGSKEYIQFLKISLGSCAELETQLIISKELGYCTPAEFDQLNGLNSEVIKLLRTYIRRLTGYTD